MQRKSNSKRKNSYRGEDKTKGFKKKDGDKKPKTYSTSVKKTYSTPANKTQIKSLSSDGAIRLNRYISNAGVCSRREADKFIESGIVSINGKIVTELGTKVVFGDVVRFNDEQLTPEKKTYILMNKPKDYVTSLDDPHAKRTVIQLIEGKCKERVYPVGRLDRATTGLLLLTNDGELSDKLSHPRNNKKKIYQITLDKAVDEDDLRKLYDGVELEDGIAKVDQVSYVDPKDRKEIGIEIHSGKNRIVRRMFEYFGYKVRKLDRVYFAGLTKKNLPRGKWRYLNEKEVNMLKRGVYN